MRSRRTKQGEQRVADELVHEAAKVLHRRGQFLEQFVLQACMTSGSSRSLSVVNPLRSAKSTVMVRRSASVSSLLALAEMPALPRRPGFGVGQVRGAHRGYRRNCPIDGSLPALGTSPPRAPHFGQYAKSGAHV